MRRGTGRPAVARAAAAVLVMAAAAAAAPRAGPAAAARAPRVDTVLVAGLGGPVEILRDSAGVAHIYARSERDLFFAQGYNAARDRLFQLELWRRQATGTLAEALGPRHVERDRAARLFRFRGDMGRELAHYHPRGAAIVGAFVDGVNAYVARTERDPSLLPPEFAILGMRPGRWTPAVVVSRHNALASNATEELTNARAVRVMGAAAFAAVSAFEPAPVRLAPDPALDLDAIEARADSILAPLARFGGRRDPLALSREDLRDAPRVRPPAPLPDGSNNWVVSGARTASGKPLLANDPHRAIAAPSLRYWVHLVAPGWDVVGGGEPALPGVAIGHNAHGAWGLTIFGLDTEDVYAYELHPADDRRYRYRGAWEPMRVERDTVRVRGAAAAPVELRFTRHGPVTYVDRARRRAYAVRAAWLAPGSAPYLASLRMDQARGWEEFRRAASYSLMPAENYVWADTGGTIGWQAAGIAPRRRAWSGLLPVPGDGRYEWDGFLPVLDLPHAVNPPAGFIATANENVLPPGYPHVDAVARSWAEPWRGRRAREALAAGRALTAADMARLQHDELSLPARRLVPLLRGAALPAGDALARWARDTLLAWDHVLGARSVPAAVYVAWERRLGRALRDRAVPATARPLVTVPVVRWLGWLEAPARAPAGAAMTTAGRDSLLGATLADAARELRGRLGPDPRWWRYGQERYKHALVRHPLSAAVDSATRARLDVGPLPRGGYAHTLNATGDSANQTHGASFRLVADLADWDRSLGTNAPGQSGDPRSPHYRDLFPRWARGEYFRVPYTRAAVERAAEARELLTPVPR